MPVCQAKVPVHRHRDRCDRHQRPASLYIVQEATCAMSKKYAVLKLKTRQSEGGFLEAFALGLVDLNSWGNDYYDMSGYPYPDETHAFLHDWINLGGDFSAAMQKMNELKRDHSGQLTGALDHGQRGQQGQGPASKEPATATGPTKR